MPALKRCLALLLLAVAGPLAADAVWIDVRSAAEYHSGHVDGALLMPHGDIGALIGAAVPDRDTEIHLYCRSGRRADAALQTLRAMGYTRVSNEGSLAQAQAKAQRAAACQRPAGDGTAPC